MKKLMTIAAIAASAAIPMAAKAATPITNTIDGVEWRFMLDTPNGTSGTAMLGINPSVHLVAPKTIARSEGKAVRVIENRKLM